MKKFLMGALITASALMSSPAAAAVTLSGPATNQVATTSGNGGGSFTIFFDGYGGASPTVVNGLTSSITFTYVSGGGTQYIFDYVLNNTSTAPLTDARVGGFGFDTNPDVSSAAAEGLFTNTKLNGTYPVGYGNVEVCINGANSCAGSGGGGLAMGESGSGRITLNFAQAQSSISLLNFVDRYQSVAGSNATSNSAIGRQVAAVPEPGTWAMMLVGFGMIGFGLRRRSASKLLQLA